MNLVTNGLSKREFNVYLVPINAGPEDLVVNLAPVYSLNRRWRGGIAETVKAFIALQVFIRRIKPDALILNCDLPELFGALTLSRVKLIGVEHANFPWENRKQFGRVVRGILRRRKTIWVGVSPALKIWPTTMSPSVIILNPVFIDTCNIKKYTKSTLINRIIFVGRLAPSKRADWIVDIQKGLGLPGVIIGEGEMLSSLQDLAVRNGVEIEFTGFQKDPWAIRNAGDLLVIPSAHEGDGLIIIEGLAAEVPMILADIPEFRRFGFPEINYACSPNDVIQKVIANKHRLDAFRIPEEMSRDILVHRTELLVSDSWVEFLAENT